MDETQNEVKSVRSATDAEVLVYNAQNNAVINKVISNNVSGSTRVDAVIVHLTQTENNQLKNNTTEVLVITGTGPSALSDAAITASVGDDNWYRLANVSVANGAVSIVNGNITDTRLLLTFGQIRKINVDEVAAGVAANGVLLNNETRAVDQGFDMLERNIAPTTPITNHWKIYFKTDGAYILDDLGVESKLATASGGTTFNIGGTGLDGPLNVTSGTTILNLNQVYNFTTINVSLGATLAFTGSGNALMRATNNVTLLGTIELRNLASGISDLASIGGVVRQGSNAFTITPNTGGAGGAQFAGQYGGGNGGTSTAAGAGTGGAGGTPVSGNGVAGQGGNSTTGGGGGGSGASGFTAGNAGSNASGLNGGGGGGGVNDGANSPGSSGGGGGGGFNTGNGGNGGAGANASGTGGHTGGHGGRLS